MPRTTYRTGLAAEALCRLILRLKGYRILSSRFRSHRGEIDIIAMRGTIIAAIEVKARASEQEALESILSRQRMRIQHAAEDFLARHPSLNRHSLRFDVMLVTRKFWPKHLQDAWRP